MDLLLLELAALLLAPWISHQLGKRLVVEEFVLAASRVGVLALVLLHVAPLVLDHHPWPGLLALALGFFLPTWWERRSSGAPAAALAVAFVLHHLLDGLAIGLDDHGHGSGLGLGAVLHTLPLALLSWRLSAGRWGLRAGWATLGLAAASVVSAFLATHHGAAHLPESGLMLSQAFVAGTLAHSALPHGEHTPAAWKGTGFALALATVGAALHAGDHPSAHGLSFPEALLTLGLALVPAFALGALVELGLARAHWRLPGLGWAFLAWPALGPGSALILLGASAAGWGQCSRSPGLMPLVGGFWLAAALEGLPLDQGPPDLLLGALAALAVSSPRVGPAWALPVSAVLAHQGWGAAAAALGVGSALAAPPPARVLVALSVAALAGLQPPSGLPLHALNEGLPGGPLWLVAAALIGAAPFLRPAPPVASSSA